MTGSSTRERILAEAVELTTTAGWSAVTMGRLATQAGVSRQTVYNEVGGKDGLAEAVILAELDGFLSLVDEAFGDHSDDVVAALEAACRGVLEFAQDNRLLKAIASATHGADTELLPLLTTHAGSLLTSARSTVAGHVAAYDLDLTPSQLAATIDLVVRAVLSHVMEPSGAPEVTAREIAWIAERVLGPDN